MWNGADGLTIVEGSKSVSDQAIGVAYNITTFPSGKTASEWFSFATAFKRGIYFGGDDIDEEPGTGHLNEHKLDFQTYPNPNENRSLNIILLGPFNI